MKQKKKLISRKVSTKKESKFSNWVIFGVIILFISLFIIVANSGHQQDLTGNAATAITPTFGTIGDCQTNGTCPKGSISPSGTVIASPAVSVSPSSTSIQPCVTSQNAPVSIMASHRKKIGNGSSSNSGNGFIQIILQFFQLLLQLLQQLLGGGTTTPTPGVPLPTGGVQPTTGPNPSSSPCPPTNAPQPTTPGQPQPTAVPTSVPVPTTPVTSSTCTNPTQTIQIDTSNPHNGITLGNYFVDTDTWNYVSGMTQTVYVCNYNNWYVTAGNMAEAGGVKSYPNVHEDFNNVPINSFKTVTSSFASVSPPQSDIYDAAYDIWINNYAIEVMVWNDSWNKGARLTPGGSKQATVTFGGKSYDVYKSGGYIAFVATTPYNSGTVDLLQIFNWIISQGWIASNSTLGQIDYGIELISTQNQSATFKVTNFSITAN